MASLISLSNLTLSADEARETSQAVFDSLFARPELNDAHYVATGIQMQTRIPIFGQFGLLGKASSGSCATNADTTASIAPSEKVWDPKLIAFRLSHCQEDVSQLFKLWQRSPRGLRLWEDVPEPMLAFLQDRTIDATMQAILRISSFGKTTEDTEANGGHLTNGTTTTYFTPLSGLWDQIFTAVSAGNITARATIAENGAGSTTAQDNLASDAALNAMREMYNKLDARARTSGELVFQLTDSLYRNWMDFLEDKSLAFSLTRAEQGAVNRMAYRGIPIIVRYDWDRMIRTYQNLTTAGTYYLPHRAILTPISNVPIGTSDEADFTEFNQFYDRTDKKLYTDVAFYLDLKVVQNYAIAVAY